MKRKFHIILLLCLVCSLLSAYNPSVGGELLNQLSTPMTIADGSSAAGGALQYASSEQIAVNPALTAAEQRIVLNLAYTHLFTNTQMGICAYLGGVIPTKVGVFTAAIQTVNSDIQTMNIGNYWTIRTGFAKEITDKLYVGIGLNGAFGSDWAINGDLGTLFLLGSPKWLPFMKDVRVGVSLTGLGKPYNPTSISRLNNTSVTGFPSMITPKIGIAGSFISTQAVQAGISLDLSVPTFYQNLIFDAGLQVFILDTVRLKGGWEYNLQEHLAGKASFIPSVSLSVKLVFDFNNDFFAKQGWQKSEYVIAGGYRNLPGEVNAVSGGISAYLGLKDTVAPEIEIWGEDE